MVWPDMKLIYYEAEVRYFPHTAAIWQQIQTSVWISDEDIRDVSSYFLLSVSFRQLETFPHRRLSWSPA